MEREARMTPTSALSFQRAKLLSLPHEAAQPHRPEPEFSSG
jgi:hypothetical protein